MIRARVTVLRTVLLVAILLAAVGVSSADTIFVEELTAAEFLTDFGPTTGTFNGVNTPTFVSTLGPINGITYDDNSNDALLVNPSGSGFDLGTGNSALTDEGSGNGIDITFPTVPPGLPVLFVGLIAGDPNPFGLGSNPGFATFSATFGDGSSVSGVGDDGSLPVTLGNTPTYFAIVDVGGDGISTLNFSTNTQFPTIDTLTTTVTAAGLTALTPEPNSVWLLGILMLALGIGSVIRKRKAVAARLASGAAPLAVLAVFAVMVVPSRSFAQPVNCNLAVPNNPLTAVGLATPYLLSAGDTGCSQAAGTMAFVQAAIYNPAAHTISVYTPLVADAPTGPPPRTPRYAIAPVLPTLPANAVVAIWFGYNANNLTLTGTAVTNGTCFTGFGQFASCNTAAFWTAVNADTTLLANILALGQNQKGSDGLACPTARSFSIVDQDPTDNLPVNFLLTNENPPRTAQNTRANITTLSNKGIGFSVQINPSDEAVVDIFVDGALGCTPPMVADLTDPGTFHASFAVNELFAGLVSGQFPSINNVSIYGNTPGTLKGPGFVAIGDTFTLNPTFMQPNAVPNCVPNPATGGCSYPYTGADITAFDNYVAAMGFTGQTNPQTISGTLTQGTGTAFNRTNAYRAAANQPLANFTSTQNSDGSQADASVQSFCKNIFTRTGVGDLSPADIILNLDVPQFQNFTGPTGAPLFQFLANRFAATYDLLGCAAVFGQANPVNLTNVGNNTPPYYPAVFPAP